MAIKDYSATPALNGTISGINVAEGCPPSGLNDAIRQLMADLKAADFGAGAPKTDVIAESTAGAGVTIDSLLIKDGDLPALPLVKCTDAVTDGALVVFSGASGKLVTSGAAPNVRTYLGLGNAALLDAGTGAGQLVQLDGSGKLPAVSGENLTNMQSDDLTARDNAAMTSFLAWLASGLSSGAVPRGALWTFATDELTSKVNATYNADGDYYTNAAQAQGTQPSATSALAAGYTRIDKTFTVPVSTTVRSLGMYSTVACSGKLQIVRFDSTNTYTALAEVSFSHTGSGWEYFALATPYTTAASGTFYIATYFAGAVTVSGRTGISSEVRNAALSIGVSTSGFSDGSAGYTPSGAYETSATNMVLVGGPAALGYVPTKATVYILHKAVDAVTLNTDVKVRASRGSTWTFATDLEVLCQYNTEYKLLRATVDLSAQTSGSNAYWGLETFNNKAQRVRAALLWQE